MEPKIHCFSKEIFREHTTDLIALGFLGKEERNNYPPQLSMLVRPGIKSIKSVLTEYYLIVNIVCFKKTSITSKSSIFLSALHPVILSMPSIPGYTQHMAIVYLRVSSLGYIFF